MAKKTIIKDFVQDVVGIGTAYISVTSADTSAVPEGFTLLSMMVV